MAKILSEERVIEYTVEFKVKVVELTEQLDVKVPKGGAFICSQS